MKIFTKEKKGKHIIKVFENGIQVGSFYLKNLDVYLKNLDERKRGGKK